MAVRNSPKIFSHVLVLISLVWTCCCGGNSFHSVPPPQNLEFIYVGNSPGISAFQIDSSGKLQELPSSPLTALQDAIPVVADPQSRFILLGTYPVLFPAVIDSSHALSFTSKAKLPEGHFLMDPLGRFFFDAPDAGGKFTTSTPIHVYSVTADLSFPEVPGSPFEAGILPAAIDPGGKFIFGFSVDAALNVNAIATIQIGATGTLTTISTVPVANKVQYTYVFASVNASGDFLYVSSFQNQNYQYDLTVYKISATRALTPTASEPNFTPKSVPGGSFKFIGFDPADRFVYSEDCNSTACYLDTLPIDQQRER